LIKIKECSQPITAELLTTQRSRSRRPPPVSLSSVVVVKYFLYTV